MNPRIVSVLIAVALLAVAIWYAAPGGKSAGPGEQKAGSPGVAGEVMVTAPPGSSKTVPSGRIPPEFIISRDGQNLLLEDFKGKYVFVNFWNTWCPPCREEMPELNRFYLDYRDKNVEFLFINITLQEKSQEQVETFLKDMNLQLPVYLDRRGEVAMAYGVQGIPSTLVLNPKGEVVYARSGPLTYKQAENLIKK